MLLPKAVLRIKGDIHRGGPNIFVFMSFTKRLSLINHVLPELAQCLALLEAKRELLPGLSLSVLMASLGPCSQLRDGVLSGPDLLWKEPFSLSTAVFLQWRLAFGCLSRLFLVPAKALSPPPSETESIHSRLPWTGRA